MVIRMIKSLICLLSLVPFFLFSGAFQASVNSKQLNVGESLTLTLTLKDTSAKEAPSLEALKSDFFINSQQQSSNTFIINGKITSSTNWKIILIPQRAGEITIASIKINTAEGVLSSEPLTIQIVKGAANSHSSFSDSLGVTFSAEVNQAKPYKNEPVVYTFKLISKQNIVNVTMQKFDVEDAIVEKHGEPHTYRKVIDGLAVDVIEFSYLLTPLKAGPLKIPAAVIQGEMPIRRKSQSRSFFDDDFDPFSMLQGFDQLKPFALSTEEIVLEVQPAISTIHPWLPARSLKIEEDWKESPLLHIGDPITRSFKIIAEGIKSSQLPSLNELQLNDHSFKIYADKPEMEDEIKDGHITSVRKEHYTLIPQQAGSFTLPEISIAWWDVIKKEKVFARIPARTLQILPIPETQSPIQMASSSDDASFAVPDSQRAIIPQKNFLLYALIAGLVVLLFAAIFWVIILQIKMTRLIKKPTNVKNSAIQYEKNLPFPPSEAKKKSLSTPKNEKLPDLNPT